MKNAIISVFDKSGIDRLVNYLINNNYQIWSSGGTYKHIVSLLDIDESRLVHKIDTETGFPEILGGRVKTLHPRLYGGILADRKNIDHVEDMRKHKLKCFDLVVVNLYPFKDTVSSGCSEEEAIENIDIGGVSLIRAAAKNYKHLTVLTHDSQYDEFISGSLYSSTISYRRDLAADAFRYITRYDRDIASYFDPSLTYREYKREQTLKYGLNPSQAMAHVSSIEGGKLPFTIINGNPGYINMIDMIQSWRLVQEVTHLTGYVAATSFKHTTPTGLAIGNHISMDDRKYFHINESMNSKVAIAYMRARDIDPLSSFGDFVAISGIVDYDTAVAIRSEVTDGIIALGYESDALELLKKKKGGKYIIIIGKDEPPCEGVEYKEYGGSICLVEDTCDTVITIDSLESNLCNAKTISADGKLNMILSNTLLKYTPSNSVAFAYKNMVLGVGAGQQNRVDCVRLAGDKYNNWLLRHHRDTIEYRDNLLMEINDHGRKRYKKQTVINKVYDYVRENDFGDYLKCDRYGLTLASDGFFPFPDGVVVASEYGVEYIIQPGGSIGDEAVINMAEKHSISMVLTGKRLFFH